MENNVLIESSAVRALLSTEEEFGLSAAAQDLCQNMRGVTLRMTCLVQLDAALPPLSGSLQLALYHITQELLQNIVKHATGATRASLELENVPGFVQLRVEDNGPCFAADALASSGLGLHSIHDRVALLGGHVEVGTVPGFGTYVLLPAGRKPA